MRHTRREGKKLQQKGVHHRSHQGGRLRAAGYYEAMVVVESAIAGSNLQADVRCPAESPSLCSFFVAPNFSDVYEEIIGAWIWRSSRMARLGSVNNTNEAS